VAFVATYHRFSGGTVAWYLAAVGEALEQIACAQPDLVLYNTGIDFLTPID
jgi:hypothetical protein